MRLSKPFTPLALELRTHVDTKTAAWHLGRSHLTLQGWARNSKGPITPVKVGGRLAWRVADIRRLLA